MVSLLPDHLGAVFVAVLLFPLVLWIPGAVLGFSANLLEFRTRSVAAKMSLGLLFSLAVCPISVYLLARVGGFRTVWIAYVVIWLIAAVLAVIHRRGIARAAAELIFVHRVGLVLAISWIVFGVLWEIDFVTPTQVWRDLNTMDAMAHVAFTNAITRTGIPPANPFVYPGFPVPLFYYYGWYLICSLVDQLGGSIVTARAAVQAGTVYVGFAVAAAITACVGILGDRIFGGARKVRWGVAIAMLAVTGLDLIPWTFLDFLKRVFGKGSGGGLSIEWWNEQVTAWMGAILMSPHHPLAMAICFTMALLIFANGPRNRLTNVAVIAFGFASAAAISAYVVLAFGAGMALWCVIAIRRRWWRPLSTLLIAGAVALTLYAPFLLELRSASHESRAPIGLTVRAFLPVDYWLPSIFKFLKHTPAAIYALRLILLPVNYFFELGFFLVAAILYWRWRRSLVRPLDPVESMLACAAAGSVLVCTFLISTLRWNDLGWRGFLVAQFVLLLWAVPVAEALLSRAPDPILPARWRSLALVCVAVGVAGTLVEMGNMRLRFDGLGGPQAVADREAYRWIDANTPQDSVILFNPDIYLDYFSSLYGNRQQLSAGQAYGTFFSSGEEAARILQQAPELFSRDGPVQNLVTFCNRYHAGVVLVQATDPVWTNSSSWIWKAPPAFANERARVFDVASLRTLTDAPAGADASRPEPRQ